LLGMDFFARYIVRIDFDRGRLALIRSADRRAGHPVPLKMERGMPFVEVALLETGPNFCFLVDLGVIGVSGGLGADTFELLQRFDRLTRVGENEIETAGGRMETKEGRLRSLTIGRFSHRDLYFSTTRADDSLGLNFWTRYTATFDFP